MIFTQSKGKKGSDIYLVKKKNIHKRGNMKASIKTEGEVFKQTCHEMESLIENNREQKKLAPHEKRGTGKSKPEVEFVSNLE